MRETDADCERTDGPAMRDYAVGGLGNPTKGYNKQIYQVAIYVQSPEFNCQITGYSAESIINAHQNALAKLNAPLSERPLYK